MFARAKETTFRFAAIALILTGCDPQGQSQQPTENSALPVLSHQVKLDYPPIARAARVSGDIELSVSTDGQKATGFSAIKGPVMLQAYTESSILQWQFEPHAATTFRVLIRYHLLEGEPCADPTAVIRSVGSYEYEVTAGIGTCDRARYLRNKQALIDRHAFAVGLHVLRDGEPAEPPSEVTLFDGTQSILLAVKDGVFLVPEAYGKAERLEFRARIGKEEVDIPEISAFTLEQDWTIELADRSFGQGRNKWFRRHSRISKGCVISFDPIDGDGMGMTVTNCRHIANP